jgi:hypothetical protein
VVLSVVRGPGLLTQPVATKFSTKQKAASLPANAVRDTCL